MGYRASRLYSWSEIQALARELQTMHRTLTEMSEVERDGELNQVELTRSRVSSESDSRIVRVERIRAERERIKSDQSKSRSSHQRSNHSELESAKREFNAQDFKAAWLASQQKEYSPQHTFHDRSGMSIRESDDVTVSQLDPQHSSLKASDRLPVQDHESPWEMLRDYFLEQHRRQKTEQSEATSKVK